MGVLREQATGRCFSIGYRHEIGRGGGCHLQVDSLHISAYHAELRWVRDTWSLLDKGSRNKTFLAGRELTAGEHAALVEGATFTLGRPELGIGFTLIDASAPCASARDATTHALRVAQKGILDLPDDEHPELSVFEDAAGYWVAEDKDARRRIENGEQVVAGGERWTLDLPPSAPPDTMPDPRLYDDPNALENIGLRIAVSKNEEHYDVTVMIGRKSTRFWGGTPFDAFVQLARERVADRDASPGEQGWIDRDELCRKLGTNPQKLAVDVCRLRKKFAAIGIVGAANLIERRSGDLRLGIALDHLELIANKT